MCIARENLFNQEDEWKMNQQQQQYQQQLNTKNNWLQSLRKVSSITKFFFHVN